MGEVEGPLKSMAGGEDRKRKFAAASGGPSDFEKPGKRIAAPQGSTRNGRRRSTSPLSDMDGIEALPGRPSNFPSSSTPSLLNRISASSSTNGLPLRPLPTPISSSTSSSSNNGPYSYSHLQQPGRVSPPRSSSFVPGPPPHLQPAPPQVPTTTPRTSTFNLVVPNSEIRQQPPHLARQLSSSTSLLAVPRQPPLPPPAPPVVAPTHLPIPSGPRNGTSGSYPSFHVKPPKPSFHHQLHETSTSNPRLNFNNVNPTLAHLPFHPNYQGPPPPPRIPKPAVPDGPDLISSFGAPAPPRTSSTREEEDANPNKGMNIRGRAKARAPPAFVPEPEFVEDEGGWEEEEERYEEEVKATTTTGMGLLGRMSS